MGDQTVKSKLSRGERHDFMRQLFADLRALERMIAEGMIEDDVRRIGAEQELFLVDKNWRPSNAALNLLAAIDDDHFTTELGLFNLEINLDPLAFGGDCLSRLENELEARMAQLRDIADARGVHVLLTGILPTLRKSDLGIENMTPLPRYTALNEAMTTLRGGVYELHIRGLDELLLRHDSVMLEACNASFQVHFQVGAAEFANLYNIAQIVAGPVLAAAVNSPLLFGRQLWRETRIALFQQAVDTRSMLEHLRVRSPRVSFGRSWVRDSVLEIFQEDITRFRALVTRDFDRDSMTELDDGEVPRLSALCLHNGTVYRWTRACYGVTEGVPHLRIENRVLPSGPTVADEIANAAFWFGLISALSVKFDDVKREMEFEDAALNFNSAARHGLGAQLSWFHGKTMPATKLICEHLLPLARDGLARSGIDDGDANRLLGIIEQRVAGHRTGSDWQLMSIASMKGRGTEGERLNALTAATLSRQRQGHPVAEWEPARLEESGGWKHNFLKVEQYMTTELFTVNEDESLDLVAYLMEWQRIRHVPVEDREHRLVGLISYRALLRLLARGGQRADRPTGVQDVMKPDPITVTPEDSTLRAIELMRDNQIGCLPVVKDDHLVGIITERDLMNVAGELLEQQLRE